MKKLTASLCCMLAVLLAPAVKAQTIPPLPEENSVWSTVHCHYFTLPPSYVKYAISGTFKFSGKTYYKVYTQTRVGADGNFDFAQATYFAGIRQLGSRVYMKRPVGATQINDYLLYDFGLNEGETTTIYSPSMCGGENISMKVLNVDYVPVNGQFRKRLRVTRLGFADYFTEYWIDGIGSSFGLMMAGSDCSDNSWYLACYRSAASGVVEMAGINPVNFTFCFTQPSYDCGLSTTIAGAPANRTAGSNETAPEKNTGTEQSTQKTSATISTSPNPVKDMLTVTLEVKENSRIGINAISAHTRIARQLLAETQLAAGTYRYQLPVNGFAGAAGDIITIQTRVNGVQETAKVLVQ